MQDVSQYIDLFKEESGEILQTLNDSLLTLEQNPDAKETIEELFRAAHSLKGMAATMGFDEIANLTHKMENLMDKVRKEEIKITTPLLDILFKSADTLQMLFEQVDAESTETKIDLGPIIDQLEKASSGDLAPPDNNVEKKKPISPSEDALPSEQQEVVKSAPMATVRVRLEHLDNLMDLVGELVISKACLDELEDNYKIPELAETLDRIKTILGDLQHEVMQVRMVPVGQILNRFPRMVRDIAHELGKEVKFVIEGSEIELDRTILDEISDVLVHLLRNAVGHGIELPEEREQKGKPRLGTINLIARREKEGAVIEVQDDGKGIDPKIIREIALEKEFISRQEAENLEDAEVIQLICLPGFTSAGKTTSLSGRGVGIDAVKAKVVSLGGTVSVKSELGKGARFILNLPPSLAIIKALLIKVSGEIYAIPLKNVSEVVEVKQGDLKSVEEKDVIVIHDQVVPLIRLSQFFGSSSNGESLEGTFPVVVVEVDDRRKGLIVDTILSQQDVVVKPLSEVMQSIRGLGGATILGNGRVALILDVRSLSIASGRKRRIFKDDKVN